MSNEFSHHLKSMELPFGNYEKRGTPHKMEGPVLI